MEYQKIINLSDNTPNQLSRIKTKNWVKKDDDLPEIYNTNSQIKFKTLMFKTSISDYSEAYILVKGTITITRQQNKQQRK